MGIKKWIGIGVGVLVVGGVAWFLKKKEDKFIKNLEEIINEVDLKDHNPEQNTEDPKSVDALDAEVKQVMAEMDISDEELEKPWTGDFNEFMSDKNNVLDFSGPEVKREKIATEKILLDAIGHKNYSKAERIFNEMYNHSPRDESPAALYGYALQDGLITSEFKAEAAKWYGNMWFYSGD